MTDARIYSPSDPLPPGKKPGQWTASGRVPGMQPAGSIWRVAEAAHGFPVLTYLRDDYPTEPVSVVTPEPDVPDNVVVIIVDKPFRDSDGDKIINFGEANRAKYGVDTAEYKGLNPAGGHVYWGFKEAAPVEPVDPAPPVEPPVVTPPPPPPPVEPPVVTPPVDSVLYGHNGKGEVFMQNDVLTVGLNAYGGIGTLYPAPEGFRTDVLTGLKRVGLFDDRQDDIVLQGRAIEGFAVVLNGKRYANMQLTGLTQIKGEFHSPRLWVGTVDGVEIAQHIRVDGSRVSFEVVLTNNGTSAIPAGSYMRAIDPDQSDRCASANKVTAPGRVECALDGGGMVALSTDHPGAFFRAQAYNKAGDAGPAAPSGKKVDEVVQLVMPFDLIAPREAVTLAFEYLVEHAG